MKEYIVKLQSVRVVGNDEAQARERAFNKIMEINSCDAHDLIGEIVVEEDFDREDNILDW